MSRLVAARLAVVGGLVALAAGVPAAPALAAPEVRIVGIDSTPGELSVVVAAVGLPSDRELDIASTSVTVDGQVLESTATGVSENDDAAAVERTIVLAVDVSGSMAGEPIEAARIAVANLADTAPADVRVGLVTFADTAELVVPPTTDRQPLRAAAAALDVAGETAFYDGLLVALDATGSDDDVLRSVVVLSDGGDTASTATLDDVRTRLVDDIVVNAVPFATDEAQTTILEELATLAAGRTVAADDAASLVTAFQEATTDVFRQIVVTAALPEELAGQSVTLRVSVDAGGATLTDSAFTTLPRFAVEEEIVPTAPQPVPADTSALQPRQQLLLGLAGLFVALVAVLAVALGYTRPDRRQARVERQLAVYSLTPRGPRRDKETTKFGDSHVARTAVEFAGRVAQRRGFEGTLRQKLDSAGIPLKPGEWVLLHTGAAFGTALVLFALSGGKPLLALIGFAAGLLLPMAYLSIKKSARTGQFQQSLPQTLTVISGSLSAGYSLPQALDTAAREGDGPMATELNKALVQARLGMPIEDALDQVAERMGSADFAWVVIAIRIQREVGGNLAEVLSTVADTMRERERLRRQVKALSAEGRFSAYILFGLPLAMALYMLLVRYEYISQLWSDTFGIALISVAVVMQILGGVWMRKLVKMEV